MPLPEPLPGILGAFVDDLRRTFGPDLVGVYAYGSSVAGGFDPALSDLDVCVVTARHVDEIDASVVSGLIDGLAAREPEWADRLDIVFVGRRTLAAFRAGGALLSISHDDPLQRYDEADDWLQTWYLVRQDGVALVGPPPETLIPSISPAAFTAAVARHTVDLARAAAGEPRAGALAYVGLTLGRVLCLLETGRQVPKSEAAAWLEAARPELRPSIDACLAIRAAHGTRAFTPAERADVLALIATLGQEVEAAARAAGFASRP